MKPPLRWAGGKRRLVPEITKLLPEQTERIIEPLCGGAALFFAIPSPYGAILGDVNQALINFYRVLRNWPRDLNSALHHLYLRTGDEKSAKDAYYKFREEFNKALGILKSPPEYDPHRGQSRPNLVMLAALFFYLNQTSYNGLWRENSRGTYNVPFGKRSFNLEDKKDELWEAHLWVQEASFVCASFAVVISWARPKDVIYIDPPYYEDRGKKSFTKYGPDGFTLEDQKELAEVARLASLRGAYIIASNSNHPLIRDLWEWCPRILEVSGHRSIAADPDSRGNVKEILALNWEE